MYIPSFREEPFQWYREMRQKNPVIRDGTNVHVFKYEECKKIMGDFRRFSSQFRDYMDPEMAKQLNQISAPSILILDPPRHTKLRNLVNKAFTPRRVQSYEDEIRKIARTLIRGVRDNKFDLVKSLSYPLPVLVISRILGVPEKDMDKFKIWSDRLAEALGTGVDMDVQNEMSEYFTNLMELRRDEIGDDLLTLLMEAEIDGQKLTREEINGFAILLLAAGNETTTNLITNSIITLSENPGIYESLQDDMEAIPGMVEEVLRFRSPVQSTRRIAKEDTSIGDVMVKKGDMVFVYIGSANRDEDAFTDADNFNPERKENRHIAFGEGVHFCLGAPLARLETKIVLEELVSEFRRMEVVELNPEERIQSAIMYGFNKLDVSVDRVQ